MFSKIKSFFGREERKSLEFPDLLLSAFGAPTASGITVGPETALRCSAVLGAVKVLAESFAAMPIAVYRKSANGGREVATDHPLHRLLNDAPNDWTPASEFRMQLAADLALYGNAFAFCNRVGGELREIVWLPRHMVIVRPDPATFEPRYTVTNFAGAAEEMTRAEILHIRTFAIAGLPHQGISPVTEAAEAIGLALTLETHGAGLFGRGARPAGVLEYPGALTDDLLTRLRKSFSAIYSGGENAGRTAILENGVKFTPLQLSSVDAQFLELRKFQLQEIARIWRVPLHMLADLDRTTHSNAEELGQQFISFTLLPLIRLWEDALRLTCLTPEERAEYIIAFDYDAISRADTLARFQAYAQAISSGVLCPDEARQMENRPPYPGGEIFTRPLNAGPTAPTTSAGSV
jgi:HK97 family phage portal protein